MLTKTLFLLMSGVLLHSSYAFADDEKTTPDVHQTSYTLEKEQKFSDGPKEPEERKVSFFDSKDGYLDLSDFIINKKGFVPVPVIITEPALGNFGLGFAPVFIHPNKPVEKDGHVYPIMPDMTAVFGAYTANGSWGVGGGRMGYIAPIEARYLVGGGYLDANMDFYFDLPNHAKTEKAEFNIESIPVVLGLTKQLWNPRFSVGLQYMFMKNDLTIDSDTDGVLAQHILNDIEDDISGTVSKFSLKFEYDARDNIFTPNKGMMAYVKADLSNSVFGSDYNYGALKGEFFYYLPHPKSFITGFHFDIEQSFGDQPFYLKPYINMRGIPTARFQGDSVLSAELEERWNVTDRWSLIAFGGAGKAFEDYGDIDSASWGWGYGGGFRYMLARKLNLMMGVDVAMGPEGPSWYIVFGSGWMRD